VCRTSFLHLLVFHHTQPSLSQSGHDYRIGSVNAVLATDLALGFDVISLATNGTAAWSANTVAGQLAICWTAYSTKTGNYYLTDPGTSLVTEVSVDKNLKAKVVNVSKLIASSSFHCIRASANSLTRTLHDLTHGCKVCKEV
jgi:hypothetical protein